MKIVEEYRDYTPPVDVVKIVSRLLNGIPEKHLAKLEKVVLINSGTLNRSQKRQKARSHVNAAKGSEYKGIYHPKSNHCEAYIELMVDNILKPPGGNLYRGRINPTLLNMIQRMLPTRFKQDFRFGLHLFYEIGHHIQATSQPPRGREKEDITHTIKLLTFYALKKHCYLFLLIPFLPFLGFYARKFVLQHRCDSSKDFDRN